MTDDKHAAPPAIAPQTVTPRPDGVRGDVPPPPTGGVATGVRPVDQGAPDEMTRPRADEARSPMDAMRRAARSVTAVVTGESAAPPPPPPGGAEPAAAGAPRVSAYGQPAADQPAEARQASSPRATTSGAAAVQHAVDPGTPRRVRLVVSRVSPWSVAKMAFLLSIAVGIITVVATAVVWSVLNGMHLFADIDAQVKSIVGDDTTVNVLQYVAFSRTMSFSVVIAVINIVLITALATLGAFLYNITSALVGGVHVTLTDD
ncbi:DUF3566 domain-containing protein [Luteimicrobium subarcticum]|uniref:Transmembrane protein DUF3566 n=1 Tax=Luteimicrobium subarcticum TaxID=620910 RepID=A0A2M8WJG5_9MICO|nr:DUF3566 domain-containing protein [Luteimicrobium subarcticum]PJI91062.1 transmembrane protein DUF3566 [Luteimicrobium subarcticum]